MICLKKILYILDMKNNVAVNFDYLNSFYNELIGKKKNELLDMKAVNQ